MFDEKKCYECNETFDDREFVNRHVKKHKITLQEYILKWKYDGVKLTCACNCGELTLWNVAQKDYAIYVRGHHMTGRKHSNETKQKIGEKNAVKMHEYMQQNPNIAKQRIQQMLDGRTPESEIRRIELSKLAISNETVEERQKRSEHTKKLWKQDILRDAHIQATETWKARHNAGTYDKTFEIARKKISKTITKKYLEGGFEWSRGFYISTKTHKKSYYRSSWELQFMKLLDQDESVLDWESEFTSIPYMFEDKEHLYVPDFHVTRTTCEQLVEIKSISLRVTSRNASKRDAAMKFCGERSWEYIEWDPSMI